jgi:protein-S-isoprenylcysteine O-methyltransferase Ste14
MMSLVGHGLMLFAAAVALRRDPMSVTRDLWILFCLYWLVFALNRKRTKKRETWRERLSYTLPVIFAFWLLFGAIPSPILQQRVIPQSATIEWLGVAITACGVGIAFWARWHLGANWSGVVTLKEGHELIRTGPYRSIRHPIYTGILLAFLGTVITCGRVNALIALPIVWLSFYFKARREESFLAQEFGPGFSDHQRQTGMFFPRFS